MFVGLYSEVVLISEGALSETSLCTHLGVDARTEVGTGVHVEVERALRRNALICGQTAH